LCDLLCFTSASSRVSAKLLGGKPITATFAISLTTRFLTGVHLHLLHSRPIALIPSPSACDGLGQAFASRTSALEPPNSRISPTDAKLSQWRAKGKLRLPLWLFLERRMTDLPSSAITIKGDSNLTRGTLPFSPSPSPARPRRCLVDWRCGGCAGRWADL